MKKNTFFSIIILIVTFLLWNILIPGTWRDQINSIGYAFCHRIPSHSNHIQENAFTFCARCYGMYFGALVGFIYLYFTSKKRAELPKLYVYIFVIFFFILFGIDGLNSMSATFFHQSFFYKTTNLTRQITGLGIGMTISIFLSYALNASIWKNPISTPIINTIFELFKLLILIIIAFTISFIKIPLFQELLNFASNIGFLITLSSIIIIILLLILKKENSFETIHSLIPYIIISVSISILIILSIDLIRFWLTQTWLGFNL